MNYTNYDFESMSDTVCPYCNAYYDYCTADSIPEYDDGEVVQCSECNKLFNIYAEPSIDWTTTRFSHVKLLIDIPDLNLKAGQILLSTASSARGNSCSFIGETGLITRRYYNVVLDLGNDFYEISINDAEWLGYPDGDDDINTGEIYLESF